MQYINIHTHHQDLDTNTKTILNVCAHEIYKLDKEFKLSNQLISIGLHPWHLRTDLQKKESAKNMSIVKQFATQNMVWGIGETGLDRIIIENYELQKKYFYQHIEISEELRKPLIIHCVRAYNDILAIKKQVKPLQKWIFHGFNANNEIAKQLLKQECYLSFGYNLFNLKAKSSIFFEEMPLEYLFLETDTLQNIQFIYQQAAKLKNIEIELLSKQIHKNFITVSK